MDVQLNELIEKIKTDGVKSAEENAAKIIADAERKAADVIRKAKEESNRLREVAKADADKAERSGNEALRQAGRDLVLSVRGEIENLFAKVIKVSVADSLEPELMVQAVSKAVEILAGSVDKDMEIQIAADAFDSVEAGLRGALTEKIQSGIEIVPFKGIDAGFRVSMKDGSAFFDFSDEEIAGMLARFLNPKLAKLLTE